MRPGLPLGRTAKPEFDIGSPSLPRGGRREEPEDLQRPLILRDRPHLDAADPRPRDPRGHLDRLVQIARLDDVVAAELLLGLRVRAVGGGDPALPDADRRRGGGRQEPVAPGEVAARPYRRRELALFVEVPRRVGLRHLLHHLFRADQAQVFHRIPLARGGIGSGHSWSNGDRGNRHPVAEGRAPQPCSSRSLPSRKRRSGSCRVRSRAR